MSSAVNNSSNVRRRRVLTSIASVTVEIAKGFTGVPGQVAEVGGEVEGEVEGLPVTQPQNDVTER
jgi:hypothetical protein